MIPGESDLWEPFDLNDDTPLVCPQRPADDQPCESCQ